MACGFLIWDDAPSRKRQIVNCLNMLIGYRVLDNIEFSLEQTQESNACISS